jgi:uncharacterized membrane protein
MRMPTGVAAMKVIARSPSWAEGSMAISFVVLLARFFAKLTDFMKELSAEEQRGVAEQLTRSTDD